MSYQINTDFDITPSFSVPNVLLRSASAIIIKVETDRITTSTKDVEIKQKNVGRMIDIYNN